MNVYDFDNTIYDGESVFDFFIFCLKKKPQLSKYIPLMLHGLIRYKLCRITAAELTEKAEGYMKIFFESFEDTDKLIKDFWDKNMHKIKPFYLENKRCDDIIISASWEDIISEICRRIGVKHYIASSIDKENFKIKFLCYRENKVKIFRDIYGNLDIENFYTDSKNDYPMINAAKNSYIIKRGKIRKVK